MTANTTTDSFPLMGARALVLATADQTGEAWEALELILGAGARSPRHTIGQDKLFHVVEGTVTILLGDEERAVDAGTPVFVPAGTVHCYRNDSGATARMTVTVTGRGQIEFLRGMSRLTADGPPDPAAVATHTAAFGVHMLPPA